MRRMPNLLKELPMLLIGMLKAGIINMNPINQVFLGDSMLSNQNLDAQLQLLKSYEEKIKKLQNQPGIWDQIDSELSVLNEDQKQKLYSMSEYIDLNTQLQGKVQIELLNLVKSKIESDEEGKSLLKSLLDIIKSKKKVIIDESNRELELFNKFREFSKSNPDITYEQFIKMTI